MTRRNNKITLSKRLQTMDRLTIISGTLFLAADMFAIVSLVMPDWIITDVGGEYP